LQNPAYRPAFEIKRCHPVWVASLVLSMMFSGPGGYDISIPIINPGGCGVSMPIINPGGYGASMISINPGAVWCMHNISDTCCCDACMTYSIRAGSDRSQTCRYGICMIIINPGG
ncbi:MAG: hypothetical protein KBB47_02000, partial [Bacteroidales bacterium]|nr:hypothetical protein [Bacteroidales bacterium]